MFGKNAVIFIELFVTRRNMSVKLFTDTREKRKITLTLLDHGGVACVTYCPFHFKHWPDYNDCGLSNSCKYLVFWESLRLKISFYT